MANPYLKYILFLPISLILVSIFLFPSLPNDAVQYTALAQNLFHHGIYNDPYGVVPGWIQSPGWPWLLGPLAFLFPLNILAPLTSFLLTIILIFLFSLFIKNQYSSFAWLSAAILLINPQFLISSRSGLSEPFYTLLHILAFSVLYNVFIRKRQLTYLKIALLSAVTVLMAYTRTEGIFYVVLIPLLVLSGMLYSWFKSYLAENKAMGFSRGSMNQLLQILCFLFLVSSFFYPYGKWVDHKSGDINILPKATFSKRIGTIAKVLNGEQELFLNDRDTFDELAWYGLDTTNYSLYTTRLLDLDAYLQLKEKIPYTDNSLKPLFKLILQNIEGTVRVLIHSNPFPEVFILFIMLGLYYLFKHQRKLLWFLIVWLVPAFYFLLNHVEERFFYVMLPYLSFIAAYGIDQFAKKFKKSKMLIIASIIVLFLNSMIYYSDYYQVLQKKEVYYQAAQVIKEKVPQNAKICAKNFSITFYSGHYFAKMPYCSIKHLGHYMETQNSEYLLLGREVDTKRTQFKPIYDQEYEGQFMYQRTITTPHQTFKLFKVIN